MVPVWQKLQLSVQPTWLDTHKAPRSSSGMNTDSTSCPSAKRRSHLRVLSEERCSAVIAGREQGACTTLPAVRAVAEAIVGVRHEP